MLCCEKCGHMLSRQAYPTKQCPVCGEMMRDAKDSQIPASQAKGVPPAQQPNQGPIPGQAVPQKPKKNKTKWIAAVVAVVALVLLVFQLTGKKDGQKEMAGPGSTGTTAARPAGSSTTKPTSTAHHHTWKAATCTAPKTCSGCGTTSGAAAGHDWAKLKNIKGDRCLSCGEMKLNIPSNPQIIDVGEDYIIAVRTDRTVDTIFGDNTYGECDVQGWRNIVSISTSMTNTAGLKANGTVVVVGSNEYGQCNVGSWRNIADVAMGVFHTVGLKTDGTVVAVGNNESGQCNVSGWTDIVAIAAGGNTTYGLKSDGTVVTTKTGEQYPVEKWSNIVSISAEFGMVIGLKADGTVVACYGSDVLELEGWNNITSVAAGIFESVGLKSNGTVVTYDVENAFVQEFLTSAEYIEAVAAGYKYIALLRNDGVILFAGWGSECGEWVYQ